MDYDLYSLHVSPISSTHPRSTKATRSVLEWVEEQESARCYLEWKSHRHNTWCMERCFGYLDDDSSNDATAENRDQAEEKDWGNCHVRSGPLVSCLKCLYNVIHAHRYNVALQSSVPFGSQAS